MEFELTHVINFSQCFSYTMCYTGNYMNGELLVDWSVKHAKEIAI